MMMVDDDAWEAPSPYTLEGGSDFPSFDPPEVVAKRAKEAATRSHLHASEGKSQREETAAEEQPAAHVLLFGCRWQLASNSTGRERRQAADFPGTPDQNKDPKK